MIRFLLVTTICSASVLCNPPSFIKENDVTRFFCKRKIQFICRTIESQFIEKLYIAVSSKLSCGGTSRLKKISLRSPSPITNDCRYTIKPSNLRVCQVILGVCFTISSVYIETLRNFFSCESISIRFWLNQNWTATKVIRDAWTTSFALIILSSVASIRINMVCNRMHYGRCNAFNMPFFIFQFTSHSMLSE